MVIVKPSEVFIRYAESKWIPHMKTLKIAEDKETAIYITEKEKYKPTIVVCRGGDEIYSESVITGADTERACSRIYEKYIDGYLENEEREEQLEAIEEREEELNGIVADFITGAIGCDIYIDQEDADAIIEDCKEHFLEYLARRHSIEVFRPMILEDEDGSTFYEDYPYDCMVFDDDDNPTDV